MEENKNVEIGSEEAPKSIYIKVTENGPYLLFGTPPMDEQIIVPNEEGASWVYRAGRHFETGGEPCALCRCGASRNKPYCTGDHVRHRWNPEEVASRTPLLDDAEEYHGPRLILADNELYCAFARFCDAKGRIWNIVQRAETEEEVALAKMEVAHCPAGRLVIWDKKEKKVYEPHFDPSVGIIEDSGIKVHGPIWLRGGIRVESADGYSYEIRNRVTLCRCGTSGNKPFCDGSHARTAIME